MASQNPQPLLPNHGRRPAKAPHRFSATRVAGAYLIFGFLWVGLSDLALAGAGGLSAQGLFVAAGKGAVYVLLSAGLVYWLCWREFRAADQATSLLRAVVEGTTDAVFVKDLAGRYVLFNEAAAAFVGKPVSAVLGRDDRELFAAPDAERLMAADKEIVAGGVAVTLEETLTSAGTSRVYQATKAPFHDAKGTVLGLVGISREVTEAKRAERALQESEARFREMADAAPVLIWLADATGECVWFNRQWLDFVGRTPDQELGSGWAEGVHSDDRAECLRAYRSALDARRPFVMEYRLRRHDGEYRWILDTGVPRLVGGEFAGFIGSCVDITDRKRSEEALRTSEARYRTLVDNSTDAVFLHDASGAVLDVNPAACEHLGFARDELLGVKPSAFDPGQTSDGMGSILEALETGVPVAFDTVHRRRDGTTFPVEVRIRPFWAEGQRFALATVRDISERKRSEAALRATELRLREAQRIARLGSWSWDPRTDQVWWSDALFELFGVDRHTVTPSFAAFLSLLHPDDRAIAIARVEAMRAGASEFADDLRVVRPDGTLLWIHSRARATRDKDGTLIRVEGTDQDVSVRRLAEIAARESEERLRAAVEVARLGIIVLDYDSQTADLCPRAREQFGFPEAGPVTQSELHDRFHPDDRAELARFIAIALDPAGTGWFALEHRVLRPDGSTRWLHVRKQVTFAAGRPVSAVVVTADVTDQKLAESRLCEQEMLVREAGELARVGGWGFDPETGRGDWTPETARIYDLDPATPTDIAHGLSFIAPSDRPRLEAAIQAAAKHGTPYDLELRLVSARGAHKWVRTICRPILEGGKVVRVRGSLQDITDRMRSDEALRASEERYRRLVEVLPEAVVINADDRIAYCNPACVQLFGASDAADLLGRSSIDLFAPEYHDAIRGRIRHMRETGEPVPGLDERIIRLDGRAAPVHVVATPITDAGRPAILVCLRDLSERERAMDLLRSVLGSVGDAILTIDARGIVTSANRATERLFGYSESELLGGNVSALMPEPHREEHDRYVADYLRTGVARVIGVGREVEGRRKDGSVFPAELTVTEFARDGGRHFTGVIRDITARRRLEEQFREAQKMEAVGRLAGGIAHDFNNLLTVINGYTDLLLAALPAGDPSWEPLAAVHDAGERAARLTQQLLAFSRKSVVEPRLVDLSELVAESAKLLRRLIGEDIALAVLADPAPVRALIDPGQFEQVLMNLAVNARDAMPTGGRLTVETRFVELGAGDRSHPDLPPGRYASLRVADTGCGMSPEVRSKIFEPFFTTKDVGKGTGLGLAVVHGVAKQAGGSVAVESEVGTGTTFAVLFPAAADPVAGAVPGPKRLAPRGTETLLLVEDEDAVRALVQFALEGQGYTVLAASGGEEALARLSAHSGPVHLLVTDVVMPGMSGLALAEAVRASRPLLPVLYMSGYTDDALDRHGLNEAGDRFIQKPFTPLGLARRVRAILDEAK